ncbi:MAG: hypothetical protein ACOZCO_05610 [Bacteroidota bacterium]
MEEKEYEFTVHEQFIEVDFKQEFISAPPAMYTILGEMLKYCHSTNKHKLLINAVNVVRNSSSLDQYKAAEMAQEKKALGFRIAVIAPQYTGNSDTKFIENVMINRGIFVKYCNDRDSAVKWLTE